MTLFGDIVGTMSHPPKNLLVVSMEDHGEPVSPREAAAHLGEYCGSNISTPYSVTNHLMLLTGKGFAAKTDGRYELTDRGHDRMVPAAMHGIRTELEGVDISELVGQPNSNHKSSLPHNTRLAIVKDLSEGPRSESQLFESIACSNAPVRSNAQDLHRAGYVIMTRSDDARREPVYELAESGTKILELIRDVEGIAHGEHTQRVRDTLDAYSDPDVLMTDARALAAKLFPLKSLR